MMKQGLRKLLAMLLAAMMLCGSLPLSALAETGTTNHSSSIKTSELPGMIVNNSDDADAYFYIWKPEYSSDTSAAYTETWTYVGTGKVASSLGKPSTHKEGNEFSHENVTSYPASFPTMKYNGKTYTYSTTGGPGKYTVEWQYIRVSKGANNGNTTLVGSNMLTYHVDGRCVFPADMEIEKTVSGATGTGGNATVGDILTYTITVSNTGSTKLTNVKLTDNFTNGQGTLQWTGSDPTTNGKQFNIDEGESETFTATYEVRADDVGKTLTNTATAIYGEERVSSTVETQVEEQKKISLTVKETWEPGDVDVPSSATVTLKNGNATAGDPVKLTANTDWTHTFTELSADGYWNVEGTEIEGWTSTSQKTTDADGNITVTIANTYASDPDENKAKLTLKKVWKPDATGYDGDYVEVQVQRRFPLDNQWENVGTYKLNRTSDWKETIDVDFGTGIRGYIYRILETTYVPGFISTRDDTVWFLYDMLTRSWEATNDGTLTVTNTRKVELVDVTVTKDWKDGDDTNRPDSVQVQLLKNDTPSGNVVSLSEANGWSHTWTDLPKQDSYSVQELSVPGYTSKVTGSVENGFIITNTRTGTTSVTGTKTWVDGGKTHDNATEVTLTLSRTSAKAGSSAEAVKGAIATWDGNNYTFSNLPKYDAEGYEYTYSVAETAVTGYTTEQTDNNFTNTINTIKDTIDVTGTKTWVETNRRASHENAEAVKLILSRTANGTTESVTDATAAWSDDFYTFSDLPKYNKEGYEYTYTVKEADAEGSAIENEGTIQIGDVTYKVTYDGNNITNTDQTPKLTVHKNIAKMTHADGTLIKEPQGASKWPFVHPGDIIYYHVWVTNDGYVDITNIDVEDTMTGVEIDDPASWSVDKLGSKEIYPGAKKFLTAKYVVTMNDVLAQYQSANEVTNTVTATGTGPKGEQLESTLNVSADTDAANPALTIEKTGKVNGKSYGAAAELNDLIRYTITVTNSGNVTIRGVTVKDPMTGLDENVGTLKPGESATTSTLYNVQAKDLVNGTITNTATATGTPLVGTLEPVKDTCEISTGGGKASIEVTKHATGVTGHYAGATMAFDITVKNIGNVPLTALTVSEQEGAAIEKGEGYTVNDDGEAVFDFTNNPLRPGASVKVHATHEITQDEIDAGKVHNEATATGKAMVGGNETPVSDEGDTTAPLRRQPSLSITKALTNEDAAPFMARDVAGFAITVTNTGNTTLTNVDVTDALTGMDDEDAHATIVRVTSTAEYQMISGTEVKIPKLAPDETATIYATYTVTQADVDAGASLINTATANSKQTELQSANAVIPIGGTSALVASKRLANSGSGWNGAFKAGETAEFNILVKNVGDKTQTNVVVTDTMEGAKIVSGEGYTVNADGTATITEMAPGAAVTVKAEYTVTQADIDNQTELSNTATVKGEGTTPDPTPAEIPIEEQNPGLTSTKTLTNSGSGENGAFKAGETATFDITVTNRGNTTQKNVVVTDTMADAEIVSGEGYTVNADGTATIEKMAPGATVTVKAEYTVTQADIDNQTKLSNTATVDGKGTTPDPTPAEIPIEERKPELDVQKSSTHIRNGVTFSGPAAAGDEVTFSVTVRNSGNVTLQNVQVIDPMFADAKGGRINATANYMPGETADTLVLEKALAPNGSVTFTYTYVVTEADIVKGGITNVAIAQSGDARDRVTLDVETEAETENFVLTKTVHRNGGRVDINGWMVQPGDVLTYSVTVENTGNVEMNGFLNDTFSEMDGFNWLSALKVVQGSAELGADGRLTVPAHTKVVLQASYTVTAADRGKTLSNTASYTAFGEIKTAHVENEVENPGLTTTKTVTNAPAGGFKAGETAEFDITVTNSGNTTQANVTVSEQLSGAKIVDGEGYTIANGKAVIAEMAPGATVVVKAEYAISQADIDSDAELKNTALVDGDTGENPDPTPEVEIPKEAQAPELSIVKTVDSVRKGGSGPEAPTIGNIYEEGDELTYRIAVTNSGNVTLKDVRVSEMDGVSIINGSGYAMEDSEAVIAKLAPNETVNVLATHTLTLADFTASGAFTNAYTNTATATAVHTAAEGADQTIAVTGDVTVRLAMEPALLVEKNVTSVTGANGEDRDDGEPAKLGDTIYYSIAVTNRGNVTLSGITVTDALTNDTWTIESLASGEKQSFEASYVVTEADILAGRVVNVASAQGSAPNGDGVVGSATVITATEEKNGHLTIAKTTTSTPANGTTYALGETINYSIVATNDGNLTLTDITVTDELTGNTGENAWTIESLAPGASVPFTASHVVTEADILAGGVTNVATATGTSPDPEKPTPDVTPGEKEDLTAPKNGHLTIAKTTTSTPANGTTYALGETINYSIVATNDGNLTLTDITVTDALTNDSWPIEALAPGASVTFTTSHVVTEADILAGSVTNVATATGTSPDPDEPNVPVDPGEKEDSTQTPQPSLFVVKSANRTSGATLGETITYAISVTNNGNVSVRNVSVRDPLTGDSWTIASLAPGARRNYTASHVVTEADILAGRIANTATASGTAPDGSAVSDSDSETVTTQAKRGHVTIAKAVTSAPANGAAYALGETITYSITATNDGNLALTDVTVTDPLTGGEWTIASLAPGASETFETSYAVTEADILAGGVTNVATATGTSPDPDEPNPGVTPGEAQTPTDPKRGHVTVAKAVTSAPANGVGYVVGETITYAITATNDGNLALTNVVVTDELTGDAWTIPSLAPGETSETYVAAHVVTQADVDAGGVVNVATATGASPDPDAPVPGVDPGETQTPTDPRNPGLTVTKTAPAGPYGAGDTINYSITATNTGNVTLTNVNVTDPLTGLNETIASLAPGAAETFTTTYTVSAADVAAGSVINVATARGSAPDGNPVEDASDAVTVTTLPRVTLTVRYWYGAVGGAVAAPTFTRSYFAGARYNVTSPAIAGYSRNVDRVNGTIRRDREFDVIYTANTYTLTVNYVYEDGTPAAPGVTQVFNAGDDYSVTSPEIAGYTASDPLVAGAMPGRNLTFTVIYVPVDADLLIDEYGVPLNIGNVTVNIGECFE